METVYSESNSAMPEPSAAALAGEPQPSPWYPTYKESWAVLGWYLLSMLPVVVGAVGLMQWLPKSWQTGVMLLLGTLMQVALVLWLRRRAGPRLAPVAWSGPYDQTWHVPLLLVLLTPCLAASLAPLTWLHLPHWGVDKTFDKMLQTPALVLLLACGAAPVLEEWLFRGTVLPGLVRNYGVRPAVLLSAVLFAVFHMNPGQAAPTFFIGLFLGWLYVRLQSLRVCVLVHFTNNFMAVLALLLSKKPYGGMESVAQTEPATLAVIGVGMVLTALGIRYLHGLTRPAAFSAQLPTGRDLMA
ncbi:CPBP family intramembrane metalloprotease [Hymenobacter gummosus]|uniref:CPBP family intramembrane metalloprotease n=1 Tax=Hymenobacter gummosus TaxID=1776032 RepID=A0A431U6V6_9BACT|nr:type II CAAX endopeptidase family protein [Hymenobacter gummosus]RTQ52233.1 CPBP family intramembrane metalloprotease [Hymenobacter gummosus]